MGGYYEEQRIVVFIAEGILFAAGIGVPDPERIPPMPLGKVMKSALKEAY
jgi:hypothetical protein